MKFFQETTVWDASYPVPNHTYYMKDDRSFAVGYIPAGTSKLKKFSKPIRIDVRGRKFVILDRKGESDTVYFPKEKPEQEKVIATVIGSGGKVYQITGQSGSYRCSCPGFQFRSKCKHVEEYNKD